MKRILIILVLVLPVCSCLTKPTCTKEDKQLRREFLIRCYESTDRHHINCEGRARDVFKCDPTWTEYD